LVDLLVLLAGKAGQVVSKAEILQGVWGTTFVGESGLVRSVAELRRVLEDDPEAPRFIQTIAKRGYRLVAPVVFEPEGARAGVLSSIAVLPFEDMSHRGGQEYFCDGLAEELINSLARVPGLRVVARTSAFAFRKKPMDVREIGRQLSADAVLEGGLQRSGKRLRITVQLIDTKDGYHLWSERFDRRQEDLFALEDEIARAVAEKLRVHLAGGRPLVSPRAPDPDVYGLCLKGRYHYAKENPEAMAIARECFEQAIARDARCAAAYSGLAACCWDGAQFGFFTSPDDLPAGRRAALKAVELDPTLAEAHAVLGVFRGAYDFDWAEAEREFLQALELGPAAPGVRERYAMYFLQARLRMDEALEQLRAALEVDPLSPLLHTHLAHLFFLRREYERALEEARHALELDPQYLAVLAIPGMVLGVQGRYAELLALLEKFPVTPTQSNPLALGGMGWTLALTGQHERARAILADLRDSGRFARAPSWSIAWIHHGLGETDEALTWLARAVEMRDPKILYLRTKPFWDGLRADPRFQALLSQMHLV
jgi:serine/threonine-protein kinase